MAGYLENYGAGDERREKRIKVGVLFVAVLLLAVGILWALFHNYPEERQAKKYREREQGEEL